MNEVPLENRRDAMLRRMRQRGDDVTRLEPLQALDPTTLDVLDPREIDGIDGWSLVSNRGWIPEDALIPAFRKTVRDEPDPCYRTQMMIHDGLDALAGRWGRSRVEARLGTDAAGDRLRAFWDYTYDKEGFWSIKMRLVEPVTPEQILRMLRDASRRVRRPARINVGGSCALILSRWITRPTDDVDVVNELPDVLRSDYELIDSLAARHKLRLTHFASHYLPDGWENRVVPAAMFNQLDVRVVDPTDVLTGKFFSRREKDYRDILASERHVSKDVLRERMEHNTSSFRTVNRLLWQGRDNWYAFSGEVGLPGETLTEAEQRRITHGEDAESADE
jgi:hypothetical protein